MRTTTYWIETFHELRPALLESGYITDETLAQIDNHYRDPHYWTSVITFTANWGRKPA